jgi:hypothetical protein
MGVRRFTTTVAGIGAGAAAATAVAAEALGVDGEAIVDAVTQTASDLGTQAADLAQNAVDAVTGAETAAGQGADTAATVTPGVEAAENSITNEQAAILGGSAATGALAGGLAGRAAGGYWERKVAEARAVQNVREGRG